MLNSSKQNSLQKEFELLVKQIGDDLSAHVVEPRLVELTKSWNHAVGSELGRVQSLTKDLATAMASTVDQTQKVVGNVASELNKSLTQFQARMDKSLKATDVPDHLTALREQAKKALEVQTHLKRASEMVETGVDSLHKELDDVWASIDERLPQLTQELQALNQLVASVNQVVSGLHESAAAIDNMSHSMTEQVSQLGETADVILQKASGWEKKLEILNGTVQGELKQGLRGIKKEVADHVALGVEELSTSNREMNKTIRSRFDGMRKSLSEIQNLIEMVGKTVRAQTKTMDTRFEALRSHINTLRDNTRFKQAELHHEIMINRYISIGIGVALGLLYFFL